MAFEGAVPGAAIVLFGELEVNGLERAVRVLFAVQLVLDRRAVALARLPAANDLDFLAVDVGVAAFPVVGKLGRALGELLRPKRRKLVFFKCLEVRAQWLTLGEKVMAPELDVLEQPGHVDTLAAVTGEDRGGDVVKVGHHLGLVEAALILPVPAVEAEEKGGEDTLNGVEKHGSRVRQLMRLEGSVVLAVPAKDLEDVGLLGEFGDFDEVFRLVIRVVIVVLVAECLCLGIRCTPPK